MVTTALSKSLALGGWRAGADRLPGGAAGRALRGRVLGIVSEIWSATAAPVRHAAALAFTEPPELAERIARSRSLHAAVCRAVAGKFAAAGLDVRAPQAAFYLYLSFVAWRSPLAAYHGVTTGQALARHLLDRYGMGVLPASAFGDEEHALRVRVATGLLYGDTDAQRELALASPGPLTLPWIAAALDRIEDILADLAAPRRCPPRIAGQVTGAGGQRRGTVSRVPSLSRTHSIRRSTLASSSRFITGQRASVSSMTAASAVTGSAVATTARTRTVWKCGRTDRSPWRPRMSIVNAASKSRDS